MKDKKNESQVITGNGGGSSVRRQLKIRLPKTRAGKLIIVAVLIFSVLLFALWIAGVTRPKSGVFNVGGVWYTQKQVDGMVAYPVSKGVSKDQASKQAFEYLKRQLAAKDADIAPGRSDIGKAKDVLFKGSDKDAKGTAWGNLIAYDYALEQKLPKTSLVESASGYVFVFYFGQLIETGDDYKPENAGNKKLIEVDKKYSKEQANKYNKQLKDGKIKPDELLKKINQDTRLNYGYASSNNESAKFGPKNKNPILADAENFIASGDAPKGISDVRTGRSFVTTDYTKPLEAKPVETSYYFTYVTDKGDAEKVAQFESSLNSIKSEYKGYEK
jgi:hypothetical protein